MLSRFMTNEDVGRLTMDFHAALTGTVLGFVLVVTFLI
jgi:hypothetical protein